MERLAGGRIGVVFGSLTPPEELARGAALAEELGFGDVWFSEDCFFSGGVSGLTQLLASTSTATAGLGLASVVTRHPAVFAMELAGLARMHAGRVRAAVGLGNNHWLDQMGLLPTRPLTAVTQTFEVLRSLLAGYQVNRRTVTHEYNNIKLDYPPTQPPELWIGAVNQRALQAAGQLADGVLLSVLAGPAYVTWATEQVAAGAAARAGARRQRVVGVAGAVGGRGASAVRGDVGAGVGLAGGGRVGDSAPPIVAYVLAAVDDDGAVAREAVRGAVGFFLRAEAESALVGQSKYGVEVRERIAGLRPDEELVVEDEWVDEFAVAGDAATVSERLRALLDAGADSLGLWLFPPARLGDQLKRFAADVLPSIGD